MKVLMIVTEKLPVPPIRGGAIQTYVDGISPLLGKRFDLTVLGISDPDLPERETVQGVHYVRIPGGNVDLYGAGVVQYLAENQFDLIHLFNRPRLVLPVRQAAPTARIVLSLHNDMFDPGKIESAEAEAAIVQLDRMVTVSNYVGQRATSLYPTLGGKVQTVYSGVDLDRFAPVWTEQAKQIRQNLRKEHQLTDKKVILFVGRLSPKKGADILVRAMPELARKHGDAALVLVGSKWYGEDGFSDYVCYVRSLAARSPIAVVTTGFILPEQVHHWFWAGDLFVCASQWEEPLARVHYEAMATGLPIITTARGGNPEVVGEANGVVVQEAEDPKAFTAAISQLLSDSGRRQQFGRTGRSLAEERYTWQRVAQEITEVWQSKPLFLPGAAESALESGTGAVPELAAGSGSADTEAPADQQTASGAMAESANKNRRDLGSPRTKRSKKRLAPQGNSDQSAASPAPSAGGGPAATPDAGQSLERSQAERPVWGVSQGDFGNPILSFGPVDMRGAGWLPVRAFEVRT